MNGNKQEMYWFDLFSDNFKFNINIRVVSGSNLVDNFRGMGEGGQMLKMSSFSFNT